MYNKTVNDDRDPNIRKKRIMTITPNEIMFMAKNHVKKRSYNYYNKKEQNNNGNNQNLK